MVFWFVCSLHLFFFFYARLLGVAATSDPRTKEDIGWFCCITWLTIYLYVYSIRFILCVLFVLLLFFLANLFNDFDRMITLFWLFGLQLHSSVEEISNLTVDDRFASSVPVRIVPEIWYFALGTTPSCCPDG